MHSEIFRTRKKETDYMRKQCNVKCKTFKEYKLLYKRKKKKYKIIPAKHKRELFFCYNVSYGTKKDVL